METKEKKQVVTAIGKASNILITVGVDPNVDELAGLLGLCLLLGKLDKHATAVFSGSIPEAISFLEPDKTFESTADGLRDFIIELNKDKADHLRYKLDGDVVKIFITPYKNTIIRDTDLQFSQGDYNVDLVLALGVENKTDLDTAVASHGRILHDATTISISVGSNKSELGEINWHAPNASSLCEMFVSLSRDLGDSLIDEQIATALMTGIVSNTKRFSNSLTTSDVMKTAATLMSLGANQQLIAAQLGEVEDEPAPEPLRAPKAPAPEDTATTDADGSMQIEHVAPAPRELPHEDEPSEADHDKAIQEALDKMIPAASVNLDQLSQEPLPPMPPQPAQAGPSRRFVSKQTAADDLGAPSIGGTLNATTEQAEEDNRSAIEDERNHVILSHTSSAHAQDDRTTLPAPVAADSNTTDDDRDDAPAPAAPAPAQQPLPAVEDALATLGYPAGSQPTLAELDQKTSHASKPASSIGVPLEVDDARAAVANALDSAFTPANNPAANIGSVHLDEQVHSPVLSTASALPPLPTSSTALELPALPPLPPLPGEGTALPPLPPLPDLGELDAHSDESAAASSKPSEHDWQTHTVEPPVSNDPGKFRIPGQ